MVTPLVLAKSYRSCDQSAKKQAANSRATSRPSLYFLSKVNRPPYFTLGAQMHSGGRKLPDSLIRKCTVP